jgi:hypothetical protein
MSPALKYTAENIQNECHKTVEAIMKETGSVSYQDATNVFLFRKLAEYELMIGRLSSKITDLEELPATEFPRGQNE